jgi:hypothetical protein
MLDTICPSAADALAFIQVNLRHAPASGGRG